MHEFAHSELKSGPGGKGGKVKSRRQAIAIALKEAGASKYESKTENKKNLARTKRKEAQGDTYQQESKKADHTWVPTVGGKAAAPWVAPTRSRQLHAAERLPGHVREERLLDQVCKAKPAGLSSPSARARQTAMPLPHGGASHPGLKYSRTRVPI